MFTESNYWFAAKRYGWGWGLPQRWQGWVAFVLFLGLVAGGVVFVLPLYGQTVFLAYAAVLCALYLVVCWVTGEPPRWRWGK